MIWTIYHNNHAIGQARTWHKALDNLIKSERINSVALTRIIKGYYQVVTGDNIFYQIKLEDLK